MARDGAFWNADQSYYVAADDPGVDHLLMNHYATCQIRIDQCWPAQTQTMPKSELIMLVFCLLWDPESCKRSLRLERSVDQRLTCSGSHQKEWQMRWSWRNHIRALFSSQNTVCTTQASNWIFQSFPHLNWWWNWRGRDGQEKPVDQARRTHHTKQDLLQRFGFSARRSTNIICRHFCRQIGYRCCCSSSSAMHVLQGDVKVAGAFAWEAQTLAAS